MKTEIVWGIGDDPGNNDGDWKEGIHEDYRSAPCLQDFKQEDMVSVPSQVIASLVSAQKFIGGEKIPVPKDKDDTDALDMLFKAAGRPESHEGYEIDKTAYPEGMNVDEGLINGFREMAHKNGFNNGQVNEVIKWYLGSQSEGVEELQRELDTARVASEDKLKTLWGGAYGERTNLARKTMQALASEDAKAFMEEGAGNDPIMVQMFYEIGLKIGEEGLIDGEPAMAPSDVNAKISEIMGDQKHPFYDKDHPGHKAAVIELEKLFKLKHQGANLVVSPL